MRGISKVTTGLATIFIAVITLFWLFHSINQIADKCKEDPSFSPACSQLNSFTLSMLIILLIIGGFVIIITATAYILLSG